MDSENYFSMGGGPVHSPESLEKQFLSALHDLCAVYGYLLSGFAHKLSLTEQKIFANGSYHIDENSELEYK